MTWVQESQYRHQYSTDGRSEMAWQPTSVWRPDSRKDTSLSIEEWINCLLFVAAVTVTVTAESFVSSIGFVKHLPHWLSGPLLIGTIVVSFAGSVVVLYSEIVKALVQFVVCGLFTLLVAGIVVPVIWHLL